MSELTLEDIAKKAGVSRSTVSRVINGQLHVSEATRKRVLEVIKSTGFSPNAAAQTLVSQRSNTIGLVLPHSVSLFFTDPYYPHLIKGIAQACNDHNYTLALFLAGNSEDQEKLYPRVSRKGLLDGVIVQSGHHGDQSLIGDLAKTSLPLVIAGRPLFEHHVSFIDIDNVAAARQAVAHLISCERKRIATITGPMESAVGVDRLMGYQKALAEAGIPLDENLVVEADFTESGGYQAMQKILPAKPDGVFAASDMMAIGAIRAARDAQMRVPEDIAFVGFDDLPVPQVIDFQLTTIRQPVVQFGYKAVETLIDIIDQEDHSVHHVNMETELIIRNTCGAPKE
ncbi:MAG: LacI family DNA-binding transcriptional regulator [Anaerolineaceae bacterium]